MAYQTYPPVPTDVSTAKQRYTLMKRAIWLPSSSAHHLSQMSLVLSAGLQWRHKLSQSLTTKATAKDVDENEHDKEGSLGPANRLEVIAIDVQVACSAQVAQLIVF